MLRRQVCGWVATVLLALASITHAMPSEPRLVDKYSKFAGSDTNAQALVTGLRNDTPVKLEGHPSFTLPTDKMGYGNVDISLALAEAVLADLGISNPTPDEIKAALVGGTITAKSGEHVKLAGILTLRAEGMGWGRIAQQHGFKLGEIMRADPPQAKGHAERPEFARPHKVERPHRPERPNRGR